MNIPPDLDTELLQVQLESKRLGGGDVEKFEVNDKTNCAFVTFEDEEGTVFIYFIIVI